MVRAVLDGSKTQTRRVVKPQPSWNENDPDLEHVLTCGRTQRQLLMEQLFARCPYGVPGDRLWVRETFALTGDNASPIVHPTHGGAAWRATDHAKAFKWKPSIHMPRWASRITLEIVSVRVERLQDISEEDARAEGVTLRGTTRYESECRNEYRALWESINGPGSWESNPYVWVVEFKRIQPDKTSCP